MKPTIAVIGAGSVVFGKNLLADVLWHPALRDAEIRLMDIDAGRLETALVMARSINDTLGAHATIDATPDRRRAVDGADFVINTMGVGGIDATRADLEIPLRFGLRQTVGDTLGIGGIFRSARSIPVVLSLCTDMKELCPDALLMTYSNPMATHCLAIHRATQVQSVGLCHGVQGTAHTLRMIIAMMDLPAEEINRHFDRPYGDAKRTEEWQAWMDAGDDPELSYTCAGINHLAFFLRFESGGKDLYPRLRRVLDYPHLLRFDPVRFELFRWLGYFMTETSAHCAEYVPYFLKSEEEVAARELRVASYVGTCEELDQAYHDLRDSLLGGAPAIETPYSPSVEYASRIINAVATDQPFVFNGNVHNHGGALIENLPGDCCVELPCTAGRGGIGPMHVGDLPPQCAALVRTNVNVQDLVVRGILEGNRQRLYQAAMMDPNAAASLRLSDIRELMDAMFEAHAERLPAALR